MDAVIIIASATVFLALFILTARDLAVILFKKLIPFVKKFSSINPVYIKLIMVGAIILLSILVYNATKPPPPENSFDSCMASCHNIFNNPDIRNKPWDYCLKLCAGK